MWCLASGNGNVCGIKSSEMGALKQDNHTDAIKEQFHSNVHIKASGSEKAQKEVILRFRLIPRCSPQHIIVFLHDQRHQM